MALPLSHVWRPLAERGVCLWMGPSMVVLTPMGPRRAAGPAVARGQTLVALPEALGKGARLDCLMRETTDADRTGQTTGPLV